MMHCRALLGWGSRRTGLFLAAINFFVLPVNLVVGIVAAHVSDRALVAGSLGVVLMALLCLAVFSGSAGAWRLVDRGLAASMLVD